MLTGILWSGVCRNDTVLAEAGEDMHNGSVIKLSLKLLKKKPTPGWEFQNSRNAGLRGIKFHLFENAGEESKLVWVFACVIDSTLMEIEAKSFLEKLVYITEPWRESEEWRTGGQLVGQREFAPILLQRMEQVQSQGRLAMVNESIDSVKDMMSENIEKLLRRGETLEELDEKAKSLDAMSKQFQKKADTMRRFHMWQNAKHGLAMGTAVTGVVAAVTVPPLVALL